MVAMPNAPVWLNQTHSTQVIQLERSTNKVLDADGSFTRTPGVVCAVMTADCLPVLLANQSGTEVAAVHAGWRGLANGIIERAIACFSGEVVAWLGPAIGQDAFEVGEDVVEAFMAFDAGAETAFTKTVNPGKWLANLPMLAKQRLRGTGVANITDCGLCTFSDAQNFFSFRRDGKTGRQASLIWIEP
jgi:YfiH family protein